MSIGNHFDGFVAGTLAFGHRRPTTMRAADDRRGKSTWKGETVETIN